MTLTSPPEYINFCDCSLCAKSGGAWGYFSAAEVTITGSAKGYCRTDYPKPTVEMQFCRQCGTTTHWVLTKEYADECSNPQDAGRTGVNMRIFDPKDVTGIEGRVPDGRNWFGDKEPAHRRPCGVIGKDIFL